MFKISAASPASCISAEGFVPLPFVAPDIWDVKLFNEEARASLSYLLCGTSPMGQVHEHKMDGGKKKN